MTHTPLRLLLIGKDARTDAMASQCAASSLRPQIWSYSEYSIPGLVEKSEEVQIGSLVDVEAISAYARAIQPDLVIVGPEEPLGAGLVDRIEAMNIPCFGPHSQLAQIETSKTWTRSLVAKYGIPGNPMFEVVEDPSELPSVLRRLPEFVIKPDGLTGGKGVRVFGEHILTVNDAIAYASDLISLDGRVLIEERLEGEEFSLQSITDGATVVHCPIVQDHKRAWDNDEGPNTGGMGSYSCANGSLPFLSATDVAMARTINEQVVEALRSETGRPYRGVLYGGFMATRDGVRLIEYNARFGDPEAMNVLPLLQTDFVDLCMSVGLGQLDERAARFASKATVCKYVVPTEYPEHGPNTEITIQASDADVAGLVHYWAAVNLVEGRVELTGSRAVAFVGIGDTLAEAEALAERGANSVTGAVRHRTDIGRDNVVARRVSHMQELRGASLATMNT